MQTNPISKEIAKGLVLALTTIIGLVLLLYFLYSIRLVIIYLILAAILALMGRPLSNFLKRFLRFSDSLSAAITIFVFVAILLGVVLISAPMIIDQVEILSRLNNPDTQAFILEKINSVNQYFTDKKIYILDDLLKRNTDSLINYDLIVLYSNNILGNVSNFFLGMFSVVFIAFFFLKDKNLFNRMILAVVPNDYEIRFLEVMEDCKDLLSRYFLGLMLQAVVLFLIYYFTLIGFNIRISHAFSVAFLCAMLNLVPYIGPLIGFFIFIFFAISDLLYQGFLFEELMQSKIYWLAGFYMLAQFVDNIINQPIIYGRSVRSHPLEIFIVIVIGGILAGVVGIMFAVPIYTMLRVFLKEFFSEIKWVRSITKNL